MSQNAHQRDIEQLQSANNALTEKKENSKLSLFYHPSPALKAKSSLSRQIFSNSGQIMPFSNSAIPPFRRKPLPSKPNWLLERTKMRNSHARMTTPKPKLRHSEKEWIVLKARSDFWKRAFEIKRMKLYLEKATAGVHGRVRAVTKCKIRI
jgi:hypothetical protein